MQETESEETAAAAISDPYTIAQDWTDSLKDDAAELLQFANR